MKPKLLFNKWIRLLLLMLLLIAVSTTVTQAQEPIPPQPEESITPAPSPQPGIPDHLAKTSKLDVLLANGEISDPLSGGHTQFTWDKIVLAWENDDGSQFSLKTYDVNATLGAPIPKSKHQLISSVDGVGSMDIAAGYLGGNSGWIQTVAAWEHPKGSIRMSTQGYDKHLDFGWTYPVDTGEQVDGGYQTEWYVYGALIRLATGDFDADGYDEIVLAWEGPNKSLNLKIYDTDGGSTLRAGGSISDESLSGGKFMDVATGDFDGDGDDEIAVAWEGQGLSVKVYDVDRNMNLTAEAKLDKQATPGQLVLATGDFNGDRVDEIVVGFNTNWPDDIQSRLYLYQVSDNLHTLTPRGKASQASGRMDVNMYVRVVGVGAGDFNIDGIDEIAFVYAGPDDKADHCYVQAYAADVHLNLTEKARMYSNWLTGYGELALDIGDMNQDGVDEIVAAKVAVAPHISTDMPDLGIFSVDPDLLAVRQKGFVSSGEHIATRNTMNGHVAMAVGGYDGKNVYVGHPTYTSLTETKQVIAAINAPPKHRDVVDGTTYDVNVTDTCQSPVGPPCTFARYETEEKISSTMALTTTRNWSVSTDAALKYKFIGPSLAAAYGQDFEKTTTKFKSVEFGMERDADHDDVVVRVEQTLDVWEYPVYAAGSDQVQGYILVTWPRKVDPTCSVNCAAATTANIFGKNPISNYRPNHEYGNALSYSQVAPTDIKTLIKGDTTVYLGPSSYHMWLKWEDVSQSETKKASKLDLLSSLKLSDEKDLNILQVKGAYAQGDVSVNKVSFDDKSAIHLFFYDIEPRYSYKVQPYIYWAKPDGRLVLDYVTTPGVVPPPLPPTWWQDIYKKPDPAFNLPWKDGSLGEAYKLLSKEITFEPTSPTAGDAVTVTAKVRNYSLIGVNNVPVSFYAGDPDSGGTLIDETTVITLNPMSAVETQVQFDTTGYADQTVYIYAVIDPLGEIQEMHTDNNKAYWPLAVKKLNPNPDPAATLSITTDDIVFEPETPVADGQVQISAIIHASGDTFTYVAMEFWDSDPKHGGRLIDGRVIPMILDGQTGEAEIEWDTADLRGQHDIWVVIHKHPDEQASTDNRAHKFLNLEPHLLYVPVLWKD